MDKQTSEGPTYIISRTKVAIIVKTLLKFKKLTNLSVEQLDVEGFLKDLEGEVQKELDKIKNSN